MVDENIKKIAASLAREVRRDPNKWRWDTPTLVKVMALGLIANDREFPNIERITAPEFIELCEEIANG